MSQELSPYQGLICPLPLSHNEQIVLGHGSGGKMSHDLVERLFLPPFDNPSLRAGNDAGVVELNDGTRLALSTDSHVVAPLFFPGGDIGRLAVCGSVNDVAMMGARPLYLTAGFILEEGLELNTLEKIIASMQSAAIEAGVQIIAGDTKVVEKGKADGLYINTCGVGVLQPGVNIGGQYAQPGDFVLVSGSIGDHGVAVLSARGELGFEAQIQSDVAPLNGLVSSLLAASERIHVLRDPTRGGLATTLNEIARQSQVCIRIYEDQIPVRPEVRAVCELLGFDPLYIANEGKLVAIFPADDAERVLEAARLHPYGSESVVIGRVEPKPQGRVLLETVLGTTRVVEMLSGELLPRIC